MKLKFEELDLSPEMAKAIQAMGFEEASPIQSEAIPFLMEGLDVIGQAQTGTGKTVAFGIPVLEKIDPDEYKIQTIVLCPTRELTIQVAEEFSKLAKFKKDITILPIYGGQSIERQIIALKKKPQIIIGTPGRVIDHINRRTLKLEAVKTFILDEADEMLNMGFIEDIELILKEVPEERQTVLFSATMPKPILELTKKYLKNPKFIKVLHHELTVPNTEQFYFEVKERNKLEALARLIDVNNVKLGLIFCNTKMKVDELVEHLQARGYSAEGLHGDMRQEQRTQVMKRFKSGHIDLLVATDVAARGIDVENIEVVFNYDIPYDEEYYVHRIGRTGRAGKKGKAFSFIVGKEIYKLRDIQRYAHTKIEHQSIPSLNEVEEFRTATFMEKIKTVLEDKDSNLSKYVNIIEKFIDQDQDYTALDTAAALLKLHIGLDDRQDDEMEYIETRILEEKKTSGKKSRLFVNVGRKDGVTPREILGAVAGETGINGKLVGEIDIYDKFSFVEIPVEYQKEVVTLMKGKLIKGKKVNFEVADSKPDMPQEGRLSGSQMRGRKKAEGSKTFEDSPPPRSRSFEDSPSRPRSSERKYTKRK